MSFMYEREFVQAIASVAKAMEAQAEAKVEAAKFEAMGRTDAAKFEAMGRTDAARIEAGQYPLYNDRFKS